MSSPQLHRGAVPPSIPRPGTADIPEGKLTEIGCQADNAKAVFLAGSFNNWSPAATPMARDDMGYWAASLPLAAGRYEYKFVVDGEWCCEPGCTPETAHCTKCVINEFGTMNRVLEV